MGVRTYLTGGVAMAFAVWTLAVGAGACGSAVTFNETAGTGGGGEGGEFIFIQGGGGTIDPSVGGSGGLPGIVDPGCEDRPPPIEDFACDPYNQNDGACGGDEGCYIYVDYPSEPCGQEVYGSFCAPAGPGQQGDPCNGGGCAAGNVCVVTGSGTQCVALCSLFGDDGCPPGLVCEPIDVEGFGGCL
ncbi:MAG: hypothetical protein AAF928_21055 [Myxococcota bacterium]